MRMQLLEVCLEGTVLMRMKDDSVSTSVANVSQGSSLCTRFFWQELVSLTSAGSSEKCLTQRLPDMCNLFSDYTPTSLS